MTINSPVVAGLSLAGFWTASVYGFTAETVITASIFTSLGIIGRLGLELSQAGNGQRKPSSVLAVCALWQSLFYARFSIHFEILSRLLQRPQRTETLGFVGLSPVRPILPLLLSLPCKAFGLSKATSLMASLDYELALCRWPIGNFPGNNLRLNLCGPSYALLGHRPYQRRSSQTLTTSRRLLSLGHHIAYSWKQRVTNSGVSLNSTCDKSEYHLFRVSRSARLLPREYNSRSLQSLTGRYFQAGTPSHFHSRRCIATERGLSKLLIQWPSSGQISYQLDRGLYRHRCAFTGHVIVHMATIKASLTEI